METTFEERKRQLERECVVEEDQFDGLPERLEEFMVPFVSAFRRNDQRDYATKMIGGLCSDLESKNAESIAYFFQLGRLKIQRFIGQSAWDDKPLREELARQVAATLGEPSGVLILDPSAFNKSGKNSVGVARQWCGRLGKVENCQVGLYLGYASSKGHALIDTELYLPQEWTSDKQRLDQAGVPKHKRKFQTRHTIFLEMIQRQGDTLPYQWIAGDDELGRPIEFRRKLQAMNKQYLLAVPLNTKIVVKDNPLAVATAASDSTAELSSPTPRRNAAIQISQWAASQPANQWSRVDVRDTEKGPLIVELLKCEVETGHDHFAGVSREMAVAIRYLDRDQKVIKQDYYLSNGDTTTAAAEFARVAKAEHRIEECFEQGKGQAGMADYEVRNWIGWHHHQTLTLVALWFLNTETRRVGKKIARYYDASSTHTNRFDPSRGKRMRFTPRRVDDHYQTIDANSAC